MDQYLDALEQEIKLTVEQYGNRPLSTIFVGGGTPTALSASQLERLCAMIKQHLAMEEEVEYTFEANPGEITVEKLQALYDGGVNRLSFGVQSFHNELLKKIGRTHKAEDVYRSIEEAKEVGFKNISVDLIYSLPNQTVENFKDTLTTAFTLDIEHFSGYSLIIEPKTVFYNLRRKGKLPIPGEDAEAAMYALLMEEMAKNGYKQYEISNFAKPGFESKHNLTYWNNEEYFGFGAGAHGYVAGKRVSNFGPLKKYMEPLAQKKLPIIEEHQVTKVEMMEEELFLGLRKNEGVNLTLFAQKYNQEVLELFHAEIEALIRKELIVVNNRFLQLTDKGRFLGNEVFQSFIGTLQE